MSGLDNPVSRGHMAVVQRILRAVAEDPTLSTPHALIAAEDAFVALSVGNRAGLSPTEIATFSRDAFESVLKGES